MTGQLLMTHERDLHIPTETFADLQRAEAGDPTVDQTAIDDRVEADAIAPDVQAIDEERHVTHEDIPHRAPTTVAMLALGECLLSDRILTNQERLERKKEADELQKLVDENITYNEAGQIVDEDGRTYERDDPDWPIGKNLGPSHAREAVETALLDRGFSEHAAHTAALAISELCANVAMHGGSEQNPVVAGYCNVYAMPADELIDEEYALVMTTNGASRPTRQSENYYTRGAQMGGRGLAVSVGFVEAKNTGRCRAEVVGENVALEAYREARAAGTEPEVKASTITAFHDSKLSDLAGRGNMTHYVRVPGSLQDVTLELDEEALLERFNFDGDNF